MAQTLALRITAMMSALVCVRAIQLQTTVQQLEGLQQLDLAIQDALGFVSDSAEQLRFNVHKSNQLNREKTMNRRRTDEAVSLAQTETRTNLLGEPVLEDDQLLELNSENKFLGSMLWGFFNKMSFGHLFQDNTQ